MPYRTLQNDSFLKALMRQPVVNPTDGTPGSVSSYTPMWLMRQAGRYLPEYKEVRAKAGSFMGLATNPELACEVTLQPLRRYPLDAAIIFSDILTIPDAMGLGLTFNQGEGPRFEHPIREPRDIAQLPSLDVGASLRYVTDAVSLTRRELQSKVPLIGFSGSPFTLACYMIEGGGSADFHRVKALMYGEPKLMHELLGKLAIAVRDYLSAQIEAGAQAVQIFDTWGGMLTSQAYAEFSLPYAQQAFDGVIREREGRTVPRIFFTKGGGQWLNVMSKVGADCLGLDWQTEIGRAKTTVGNSASLQGNLDPAILLTDANTIRTETHRVLASYQAASNNAGTGHVFNLGHGINQFTPPENVTALCDAVRSFGRS
jgi:uroporphyrinogen decarboxylase